MNLDTVISSIQETISQVQASGEVAQRGTVIEVVPHSKTGQQYARKRNEKRFEGCGPAGEIQHKEAVKSVQRRKVIDGLVAISNKLNELKGSQDWQAISSVSETIEMDSLTEALLIEENQSATHRLSNMSSRMRRARPPSIEKFTRSQPLNPAMAAGMRQLSVAIAPKQADGVGAPTTPPI